MIGLLLLLPLVYLAAVLLLQRPMLYVGTTLNEPEAHPPAGTEVVSVGDPEPVEAWYLPPLSPSPGPHPALVYAHGNGELIDYNGIELEPARHWGMGVLLVEYPGYGRSAGSPNEQSVQRAMVAGYDWLAARPDIDSARIVVMGRSLGGGAACALTTERSAAALVLLSTFTSVADMLPQFGAPGALALDRFDNAHALSQYHRPVFIAHGRSDELIDISHARTLAGIAKTQVYELPGGHNTSPTPWLAIRAFLAEAEILPTDA